MKILQVFDIAGVAYVLNKYLNRAGHQSQVLNMHDPFGFNDFYGGTKCKDETEMMAELDRRAPEADILHLHTVYSYLPRLRKYGKPIVMHYHGSELATNPAACNLFNEMYAAAALVSTPDMEKHGGAYLPNPVDTEHFSPPELKGKYLITIMTKYLDYQKLLDYTIPNDLTHAVYYRDVSPFTYAEMPGILRSFEGYIDIKYHKERGLIEAMSLTGLQALACGLSVLDWRKEWVRELPEQHKPQNVVSSLVSIYEGILK